MMMLSSLQSKSLLYVFASVGLAMGQTTQHTGYVVDNLCWDADGHVAIDNADLDREPWEHTKMCMLLDQCVESGYGLLEQDASGFYTYKYRIHNDSTAQVVAFVNSSSLTNNFVLTVEGTVTPDTNTLTITSIEECVGGTPVNHVGYLVDNRCWDADNHTGPDGAPLHVAPERHTKMCLLLPECIDSGFALLEQDTDNSAREYSYLHRLDESSNTLALDFINASSQENDFLVRTIGHECNGNLTVTSLYECEEFTHTGYLVDNRCWEADSHTGPDGAPLHIAPERHTKMCLLLEECIESGFGLLEENTDGTFSYRYTFDTESNALALEHIESSEKESDFLVSATGLLCGGAVRLTQPLVEPEAGNPDIQSDDTSGGLSIMAAYSFPFIPTGQCLLFSHFIGSFVVFWVVAAL